MKKIWFLFAGILIMSLLLVPVSALAAVNGTLDQSNEGFGGTTVIQHAADRYLGQEFVPSMSTLMGVEVYIVTLNPGNGDAAITMNVRETFVEYGYPNNPGPILATISQTVTDGYGGWLYFELSSPLTVTIGTTYLIELTSPNNTHGWEFTQGNAYPSGAAIWGLYPVEDYDQCFRTYAPQEIQAPAITSASSSAFAVGKAGSFTVTTTGYPVPALSSSGDLPLGVTFVDNGNGTATLSGTPAAGTEGIYSLTFTAAGTEGSPAVQSFTLTVTVPLSITAQPQNQTRKAGEIASFSAAATGLPTPTVQWQYSANGRKWSNINGATSTTYETDPVTSAMNNYQYRAVFSNPGGSVTTSPAILTVTPGTADVGITKTGVYNATTRSITWTITVTNNGPDTAQGVKVIDQLAKGTKLYQVSGEYTYKAQGSKITINIGTIETQDPVKIIAVESLVKRAASPVNNTVTVTTTGIDNNPDNNTTTGSVSFP